MPALTIPFNFSYTLSCAADPSTPNLGRVDINGAFVDGGDGYVDFIISSNSAAYQDSMTIAVEPDGSMPHLPIFQQLPNASDYVIQGNYHDGNGGLGIKRYTRVVVSCTPPAVSCDVVYAAPTDVANVTSYGAQNGSATFHGSSATDTLEISFNGGAFAPLTTPNHPVTGLGPGVYPFVIRQVLSPACTLTGDVTITEPAYVCDLTDFQIYPDPTTRGLANGQIEVYASSSALLSFSIQRDGGQQTGWQQSVVFPNLASGDYTVFVRDAQGCNQQGRTSIASSIAPPNNTGYLLYSELEEYYPDNNQPTGRTAPNVASNPNYVAPQYDVTACPLP